LETILPTGVLRLYLLVILKAQAENLLSALKEIMGNLNLI